jgi:hypothetical protein
MNLLKLLFVASVVGCASVEIPDFKAHITLPASQDGFYVKTVSDEEGTIPAAEWKKTLAEKAHIILFSEDWSILRFTILKNCLTMDCQQSVGALDFLFETVDSALKKKKDLIRGKLK